MYKMDRLFEFILKLHNFTNKQLHVKILPIKKIQVQVILFSKFHS